MQNLSDPDTAFWISFLPSSPTGPGERFGHTALFDPGPNDALPRMLVFGGLRTDLSLASTDTVWSLNLSGTPQWTAIIPNPDPNAVPGIPMPREGHSAVADFYERLAGQTQKFRMVIFGGHDGTQLLNETWSLRRPRSGSTYTWEKIPAQPVDSVPVPRTRHTAVYDSFWDRMVVFGGDGGAAGLRNDLWAFNLNDIQAPRWSRLVVRNPPTNPTPVGRAGHTAVADGRPIVERVPELFHPDVVASGPGAWETLPSATLYQTPYPFMFVLPSGNVLHAGPEPVTRVLRTDLSPGQWSWAATADTTFSDAGSAVMYRPGSVLRCGSATSEDPVARTDTIQFAGPSDLDDDWKPVATISAKQMLTRRFHNLTMLPTGDVIVTGGLWGLDSTKARKLPQIWKRTTGSWNDYALAADPALRNYHSAAIILPDARLLSTGGERFGSIESQSRFRATIFEPPYLFNADGSYAPRPVIAGVPCHIGYGCKLTIQTPNAADILNGGTVCLIRPGAVTHGFNQDQRYVPLQVSAGGTSNQLRVVDPGTGGIAPPGDYLLFLVSSAGVPSVGRWLRVSPGGPPGCITPGTPPNPVTPDPIAEIVSDTEIWLLWTAPGDPPSNGTVLDYDLRASTQPMTSDALFYQGACGEAQLPLTGPEGPQYGWVSGLMPCTPYRFRVKAMDAEYSSSPMSNEITVSTICGGGGGGFDARPGGTLAGAARAPGGESDGANESSPLAAGATNDGSGPLGIVPPAASAWAVEMRLDGDTPVWTVYALGDKEAQSLLGADSAGIVVQSPEGQGGRLTRARLYPGAGSTRFAVRRLHQPGRLVFRGKFEFRQAWSAVATGTPGEVYEVFSARHSRLGDQLAMMDIAGSTTAALAPGDTLQLAYKRSLTAAEGAQDWFLVLGEVGGTALTAGNRRALPRESPSLPTAFALHANQPNPFSRFTTIRFALPRREHVRLEVFDLLGRRIRTLAEGPIEVGEHTIQWDGRDAHGTPLSAGVYLARMHAGDFRAQRTMVLLSPGR